MVWCVVCCLLSLACVVGKWSWLL